ncbi:MAG: RluA family pseudouridine synthase [Amphiamblys sp. WSBS2006]|nr:MAG: RluA family pseudouridine synthase [Amphiamblys sp. WSBS2006]
MAVIKKTGGFFYVKDGMRCVREYTHRHSVYVKKRWIGWKLLSVFCREFKGKNESYYRHAMECGKILVDGQPCTEETILRQGQLVTHEETIEEPPIPWREIHVLYEKDGLFAVDKPAGMAVHPAGRYKHNTLTEVFKKERDIDFCSVVNRLDRDVSGVVLLAATKECAAVMSEKMKRGVFRKEYLCVVDGMFPESVECVVSMCYDHQKQRAVCGGDGEGKKESRGMFHLVEHREGRSLVRCLPVTGRTHQIRAQLEYLGYPISNDPVYGRRGSDGEDGIFLRAVKYTDTETGDVYSTDVSLGFPPSQA